MAAALRLEIPHGRHQSQIVLLAPHHERIKPGRRCNHSALCLVYGMANVLVGVARRNCLANRSWAL